MNRTQLDKGSIDNLCGFWRSARCFEDTGFLNVSKTWPHRYWLNWDDMSKHLPQLVASHAWAVINGGVVTPAWGEDEHTHFEAERSLLELGYEFHFQQTAMFLDMAEYSPQRESLLQVLQVNSKEEIEIFCDVCSSSFGYQIDVESMLASASNPNTHVLLAYHSDGNPAATAVLFQTGNIIGVHQVGVAPRYRRQGIARDLMVKAIAIGNSLLQEPGQREKGQRNTPGYMTLQAGDMAKGLYESLGFEEQFVYRNFFKLNLQETTPLK